MLLRKQNVKAVLLYPNRKIERSSEDHGIIKFTFNTDDTDLFTKVSVCQAVYPSTEKGGFKFLFLSDLSVLLDYFVYRQVIYMFHTFTDYT